MLPGPGAGHCPGNDLLGAGCGGGFLVVGGHPSQAV